MILTKKIELFEAKVNDMDKQSNKVKHMEEQVNSLINKVDNSKDKLQTFEVQLNGTTNQLKESIQKYDKIYLDNLFIPGIIGESNCRFRNMRVYVEHTLESLSQLNAFKEVTNEDLKASKIRIDGLQKSISTSHQDIENRFKSHLTSNIENLDKKLKK